MTDDEKAGGSAKSGKDFSQFNVSDIPYSNLQELYSDLLERFQKQSEEKEELQRTGKRRQEAHLRKELRYREQLNQLEERVKSIGPSDGKGEFEMNNIREMHFEIQSTIGQIQGKTSKILQDQERDLIRAFRARLADVTEELDKERKKNESGSVEWVQRCRKLTEELEWLRDLTEKLTAENKNFLKENRRFKRQLKTQEEDREFLIKQLVAVKKENARLRYSFEEAGLNPGDVAAQQADNTGGSGNSGGDAPQSGSVPKEDSYKRPATAEAKENEATTDRLFPGGATPLNDNQKQRYENMIAKLKRQLDSETGRLRMVQTAYTKEVSERTALQNLLKKCIEDVRQDIAQRNAKRRQVASRGGSRGGTRGAPKPKFDPRDIPLEDFTPADRINVMEWLMSQDHVIYMLYDKMFPRSGGSATDFSNSNS